MGHFGAIGDECSAMASSIPDGGPGFGRLTPLSARDVDRQRELFLVADDMGFAVSRTRERSIASSNGAPLSTSRRGLSRDGVCADDN